MRRLPLASLCVFALLAGCGGDEQGNTSSATITTSGGLGDLTPKELAKSVEAQGAVFLARDGTALRKSLDQFLGGEVTTRVAKGSADCRSGENTASIDDPDRYPFACIVEGSADGEGLTVNITLGFVGLEIDGRCWKAANERVSVTTSVPAVLTRQEALKPVNQIQACV
jgi:hypothetical protein